VIEKSLIDLQTQNAELQKENLFLRNEIANLKRMIFGSKSERFISNEPPLPPNTLFTQDNQQDPPTPLENLTEKITYTREKPVVKKGGRKALPDHLPRIITILNPDKKTEDWKCIGTEVTEELEYKPGELFVNRIERPKYIDPQTKKISIVPMPSRIVDKCIAGCGLMSDAIIGKYLDHMPLYRKLQHYKLIHNVDIPKSTFGASVAKHIDVLESLYAAQSKIVLASNYLQIDESPFKVQSEEIEGKCHKGFMWVSRDPQNNLILLTYQKGRSGDCLKNHIKSFKGKLQSDGYGVYEQLQYSPDFILFSCWAHARRYFEQALESDKERSEYILKKIQELYSIERYAKDQNFNSDQRQKWRQDNSMPVLASIKEYLDKNIDSILPSLAIGKAFAYTLKRWDKLVLYVHHGEVEIDNNLIENAIRPLALGRKNYLFAGSHESAQRSAIMYTLLGTCKLLGINPFAWLNDVFHRIKDHPINRIAELLPHNWIKSNPHALVEVN